MAGIFAYRCRCCGDIHEGSPSFGFNAPDAYSCLTDEQKDLHGWINDDLCKVTIEEHTDFFIRVILEVPIHGVSEPFLWGGGCLLRKKAMSAMLRPSTRQ